MKTFLHFIALCGRLVAVTALADTALLKGVGQYAIPDWFKNSFLDLRDDAAGAYCSQPNLRRACRSPARAAGHHRSVGIVEMFSGVAA
jgi:hypothetical protein